MTTFKEFVLESINDKGILKAIFIVGLPGAGKSYTARKLNGVVSPRIVNTDKAAEFLSKKWHKDIKSDTWADFKDTAHRMTSGSLANYIDSMLPLFVDGTSNDISNLLHRVGILESLGYDVGVVFVHASLATATRRAEERAQSTGRHVDKEFIAQVHKLNRENANYLKSKVSFYKEVENDSDILDDAEISAAFKAVQGFFSQPVSNPVGQRIIQNLKDGKQSYMVPSIITKDVLDKKVQGWYKS